MFVESTALKRRQIEGNRVGFVSDFPKEIMATKMVFGEFDELRWWGFASVGEDLLINMGAELLDTNLIVSSFGQD